MEEQNIPAEDQNIPETEIIEQIVREKIPFVKSYSSFDEDYFMSLETVQGKESYISSLITNTETYKNLWVLNLPLDVSVEIVELLNRAKLYETSTSARPLELIKSAPSKSGKSWTILWSRNTNMSKAVIKLT